MWGISLALDPPPGLQRDAAVAWARADASAGVSNSATWFVAAETATALLARFASDIPADQPPPFRGLSFCVAPLAFVVGAAPHTDRTATAYSLFYRLYNRHLWKLHTPACFSAACRLVDAAVAHRAPRLTAFLSQQSAHGKPSSFVSRWLAYGFAAEALPLRELFRLWDAMILLDTPLIFPAVAAAILCSHEQEFITTHQTPDTSKRLFDSLTSLKGVSSLIELTVRFLFVSD